MASFNYFFCILGILFCQVCLVYSSCREINDFKGDISYTYYVRGASLYHKCWSLKNPEENVIFIQLNNVSFHNRPASGGVLTIKFLSENKDFNVSSQSQLRNFTTTSSVVEIHFKVNSGRFADGMKTGFSLDFNHNCNRILTELYGSINTPNYPRYGGVSAAECIYEIRLRPGYLVNITFHDVEIGYGDNDDCNIDYIQIRDGNTEKSPLIAEICGSIETYSVLSTSNHLWMKYKYKAGYFISRGFYANYSAVAIAHDDCYPRDSFRCANNTCIPKSEVCDGIKNCENGADELGCDQIVGMTTNVDGPKEEVTTDSSKQTVQTTSTIDKFESTTMAQELPQCANGTKHSTIKDVMDIAVEEHRRRLEVIELQKRYEMDRIEFQKIFEIEKLKQMKQYHNFKIRGAKNKLSKDSSEE